MTPALGRVGRYSMTIPMQAVYRALAAEYSAHGQNWFRLCEIAGYAGIPKSRAHAIAAGLVKRGWLYRRDRAYVLDEPVMQFRPCTERTAA